MTARQQSLAAKTPRYGAFYFTEEDTTGIAPLTIIRCGEINNHSEVRCIWDGAEVKAFLIMISNSRFDLNVALEEFTPPTKRSESEQPDAMPVINKPKTVKKTQGQVKQKATSLAVGQPKDQRLPEPSDETPCAAAYFLDDETREIIDGCHDTTRSHSTQTSEVVMINNSTQTTPETVDIVAVLLERIDRLESSINSRFSALEMRVSDVSPKSPCQVLLQ